MIVLRPWWALFSPLPGVLVGLLKTLDDLLVLKRRNRLKTLAMIPRRSLSSSSKKGSRA
jgi:hypothetical protein